MGLLGQLGSALGGNSGGSLAGELFALIQNQPGGLSGMVQQFQDKGLAGIVNSWVGTGQNLPISPGQVHAALGSDVVQQMAGRLGISPDMASTGLTQLLPSMIDKLTPQGEVPDHSSVLSMGMNVLQSLLK